VFSLDFPEVDEGLEFASLGWPVPGLEMRIVDNDDGGVPQGQVGELQVRQSSFGAA
jgi:acyl-CoA synthetase (AMP-forming)/AMP-acid ligase II